MNGYHITQTPTGSLLEKELKSLSTEQHSPSSIAIGTALTISLKTEIGYQTSYTFIPKAKTQEQATKAVQALYDRTPVLLETIFDAIASNKTRLVIEIPNNTQSSEKKHLPKSGHEKLTNIPKAIKWLLS